MLTQKSKFQFVVDLDVNPAAVIPLCSEMLYLHFCSQYFGTNSLKWGTERSDNRTKACQSTFRTPWINKPWSDLIVLAGDIRQAAGFTEQTEIQLAGTWGHTDQSSIGGEQQPDSIYSLQMADLKFDRVKGDIFIVCSMLCLKYHSLNMDLFCPPGTDLNLFFSMKKFLNLKFFCFLLLHSNSQHKKTYFNHYHYITINLPPKKNNYLDQNSALCQCDALIFEFQWFPLKVLWVCLYLIQGVMGLWMRKNSKSFHTENLFAR